MNLLSATLRPRALLSLCLPVLFLLSACVTTSTGAVPVQDAKGPPSQGAPVVTPPASTTAAGTATATTTPTVKPQGPSFQPAPGQQIDLRANVAACWLPLVQRLQADNLGGPLVAHYFSGLAEYSPAPMGVKVKELFTNAFIRKPPPPPSADGKPVIQPPLKMRIYRNVVTAATMEKCRDFLTAQQKAFAAVEKKYAIPKETIVSLLFVETRLGTFIGKENAFWSLACMAAADAPERVAAGITDLPITEEHGTWLRTKLTDKSNWAYNELKALLVYCGTQNLDPLTMPGSVYGAIGLCQFMPSNLIPYGDDGDGDGVVNLFSEPDAIFSVARYLTAHGWKSGLTTDQQRSVLKRYNNLTIYANTILTLAESLRTGELQTSPPDAPKVAAKTGAKASKSGAKGVAQKGSKTAKPAPAAGKKALAPKAKPAAAKAPAAKPAGKPIKP